MTQQPFRNCLAKLHYSDTNDSHCQLKVTKKKKILLQLDSNFGPRVERRASTTLTKLPS